MLLPIKLTDYFSLILLRLSKFDSVYEIPKKFLNFLKANYIYRSVYRWDEIKRFRGLGMFIVGQDKPKYKVKEKAEKLIEKCGFEILLVKEISSTSKRLLEFSCATNFWDKDYPFICVLVFDKKPMKMFPKYFSKSRHMDNARLLFKHYIRPEINSQLPPKIYSTYVHTTDNVEETWEYLKVISPESIESIASMLHNDYKGYYDSYLKHE